MTTIEVTYTRRDGTPGGFRYTVSAPYEMQGEAIVNGEWIDMGEQFAEDIATLDDAENFLRSLRKPHAKYRRF